MSDQLPNCWDFMSCPRSVCSKCPVFLDKSTRCWEYENARCKTILGYQVDCADCRYFRAMALLNVTEEPGQTGRELSK